MSTKTSEIIEATAVCKAINRHCRKAQVFQGGRQFGVDYTTWAVTYPQMAHAFQKAAKIITGRDGRFMPRF